MAMADLDLKSESKAQQEGLIESLMKEVGISGTDLNGMTQALSEGSDAERLRELIAKRDALAILSSTVEKDQLATVVREPGMEALADTLQAAMGL